MYVNSNGEALVRTKVKFSSLELKFNIIIDTFTITGIFNMTYDMSSSSPEGEWIKIKRYRIR